ncbi:uncharacterized protein LOC119727323 [Patiria miniata]|uniref:Uncharacterized protein n=1 Tax=Patiria miniata TaxID=46514 RepID=A0A913ZVK7_PATMI|nr:uncharacterized protein LOC119727323 [Patiria miniata]
MYRANISRQRRRPARFLVEPVPEPASSAKKKKKSSPVKKSRSRRAPARTAPSASFAVPGAVPIATAPLCQPGFGSTTTGQSAPAHPLITSVGLSTSGAAPSFSPVISAPIAVQPVFTPVTSGASMTSGASLTFQPGLSPVICAHAVQPEFTPVTSGASMTSRVSRTFQPPAASLAAYQPVHAAVPSFGAMSPSVLLASCGAMSSLAGSGTDISGGLLPHANSGLVSSPGSSAAFNGAPSAVPAAPMAPATAAPCTTTSMGPALGSVPLVSPGGEYGSQQPTCNGPNIDMMNMHRPLSMAQASVHTILGFHVSQALKEKIWQGSCIDLALLRNDTASAVLARTDTQGTDLTFALEGGSLVLRKPGATRKKIESLDAWQSAFHTFMAIYLVKHTNRFAELLRYAEIIRTAHIQFPGQGWKVYDEQFRLKQEADPPRSWGQIDSELWLTVAAVGLNSPSYSRGGLPAAQTPRTGNSFKLGNCFALIQPKVAIFRDANTHTFAVNARALVMAPRVVELGGKREGPLHPVVLAHQVRFGMSLDPRYLPSQVLLQRQ